MFFNKKIMIAAGMLCVVCSVKADEYTQGMKAYMAKDYSVAQTHWLNAVKQDEPKAMFNLGLLHQQNKLNNSDLEKAENWFKLAGKNGYAAADFHLAKWKLEQIKGGEQITLEIKKLLQRSANNGFFPAQSLLKKVENNIVISEPKAPLPVFQSVANTQVAPSKYRDETWIVKEEPSNWTIQMLAFKDKQQVYRFIDQHALHNHASYFAEKTSNGVIYKLIYGSFKTKQEAADMRDNMPSKLKEHGPWLRQISSIQDLI